MSLVQPKVVVFLEDLYGPVMSIIRNHDAERHVEALSMTTLEGDDSFLAGFDVLSVVFDISIALFNGADRKTDLDARVSQSFTKTTGD